MKHLIFPLLVATLFAITSCQWGNNPKDPTTDDATATDVLDNTADATQPVERMDTIIGWVGDATSMHMLQLITCDDDTCESSCDATTHDHPCNGDTLEFELSDDVDRRAELVVGHKIAVILRRDATNDPQVIATFDPKCE